MAKKKKTESAEQYAVIVPVSVENITITTQQEIEVPPGYVLLVALNEDGMDKAGSEFFYPEKNYLKYYADETKFRLKTKTEITDNSHHYEYLNRTSQQITLSTTGRCSSCGR